MVSGSNQLYVALDETNAGLTEGETKRDIKDAVRNVFNDVEYKSKLNDGPLKVVGWGTVSPATKAPSAQLMSLDAKIVQKDKCKESLKFQMSEEEIICAAGQGESDACQGDSGGPLYAMNSTTGVPSLVGLVSYGVGCAERDGFLKMKNRPGIYTSVHHHRQWIQETMNEGPTAFQVVTSVGNSNAAITTNNSSSAMNGTAPPAFPPAPAMNITESGGQPPLYVVNATDVNDALGMVQARHPNGTAPAMAIASFSHGDRFQLLANTNVSGVSVNNVPNSVQVLA